MFTRLSLGCWSLLCTLHLSLFAQNFHQDPDAQRVIDINQDCYLAQTTTGSWGLCDVDGEWLIPAEYDTLSFLPQVHFDPETYALTYQATSYLIAKNKTEESLWTLKGRRIVHADGITPRLMKTAVLVRKGQHWGLISIKGKPVLPLHCTQVAWQGDLLALEYQNNWYLFNPITGQLSNKKGYEAIKMVIPPTAYKGATALLLIKEAGKWGVMNLHGQWLVPTQYEAVQVCWGWDKANVRKPRFAVYQEDKWQLLNNRGWLMETTTYSSFEALKEVFAAQEL